MPGAAGLQSGRVPSLSRPDQGAGGLRAARAWPSSPTVRSPRAASGATRCWRGSAAPTARARRKFACAGWCSSRSPRSRGPRDSSGCRRISRSSISSCPAAEMAEISAMGKRRRPADRLRFRAEMGLRLLRRQAMLGQGRRWQDAAKTGWNRTGHTHGRHGVGDRASVDSGVAGAVVRGASVRPVRRADRGRYRHAAGNRAPSSRRSPSRWILRIDIARSLGRSPSACHTCSRCACPAAARRPAAPRSPQRRRPRSRRSAHGGRITAATGARRRLDARLPAAEPDLSVKYNVMLGLPTELPAAAAANRGKPDDGFDATASSAKPTSRPVSSRNSGGISRTCSKLPPS